VKGSLIKGAVLACTSLANPALADPPARESVAVVVRGDDPSRGRIRSAVTADAALPVDLQLAELPTGVSTRASEAAFSERIASARRAYVTADFGKCLGGLGDEALVPGLLASGQRLPAARVLLWRTACNVGGGHSEAALRSARELGTLGLEVPQDVGMMTPEVEAVVSRALKEADGAARAMVEVKAPTSGGTLTVDGRPASCTPPCTLELTVGTHVFRLDADGLAPQTRVVRAGEQVSFSATPASPDVAAQQWIQRYAGSTEVDSAPSLRLLSTALRAPRLVLLTVEREGEGARLRGTLEVEQGVVARVERSATTPDKLEGSLDGLLRDLLVQGKVMEPSPALYQRPLFWVVVSAVAVAAGGTALYFQFRVDHPAVGLHF
jgi:hypothetical protein